MNIPSTGRNRAKLATLIRSVRSLKDQIGLGHYPSSVRRRQMVELMQALGWALEELGYPPVSYDQVLDACARPSSRKRKAWMLDSGSGEEE